jgi:hypothetical protein
MGSDYAVVGHVTFARKAGFAAFVAEVPHAGQPLLLPVQDAEFQWARTAIDERSRELSIEVHLAESYYARDVAPALEVMIAVLNRHRGRGQVHEIEVGGGGRCWQLGGGRLRERPLSEEEASQLWDSRLFGAIRSRLGCAAAPFVEELDERLELARARPSRADAARHILARGLLRFAGDDDGVPAARRLLDEDASLEAVDVVLNAVERKWARPNPLMLACDEAIVAAVLPSHPHAGIVPAVARRLQELLSSQDFHRREKAAVRMAEALSFILAKRALEEHAALLTRLWSSELSTFGEDVLRRHSDLRAAWTRLSARRD